MKLITTYYLIFIFLCAGFSTKGQNPFKNKFEEAKILEDQGALKDAYIVYERIAFESDDLLIKNKALLGKALVLKKKGDYLKAQRSLERINYSVFNDSLHFISRYETALCAYLEGNFYDAISQFEQLYFYSQDSALIIKTLPLQILVYNELQNWDHAWELLVLYSEKKALIDSSQMLLNELITFYNKKNIPRLKNVNRAQLMSSFLPGSGQIYAGYVGEGLLNFTFIVATLGVAGYSFYLKYYFTGYFAGLALFQKFYLGSSKRVEYLVEKRNYINTRNFNEEVKMKLLKVVKG